MEPHIARVTPEQLTPGDPTPGMDRHAAIVLPDLWSGLVHTHAGMTSGWHHHGAYDTIAYVVAGAFRLESGPGGTEVTDSRAGDFVHIPAGLVHREGNPTDDDATVVLVRRGSGPVVVNVAGPDPV
ncbi:MAG: hypothetical protein NVSMB16_00870 [Acidimicrobiales bacterium]